MLVMAIFVMQRCDEFRDTFVQYIISARVAVYMEIADLDQYKFEVRVRGPAVPLAAR